MAVTLLLTTDQTQTVAYGRNFSDIIYKAGFSSADVGNSFTLDLTVEPLNVMNKFFVSVSPGTIILFSNTTIPSAVLNNEFRMLNGEMVAYDSLFTLDQGRTTLFYMPVAVPVSAEGVSLASFVSLSFFV